ncbi:MAG: site-specific DNA-methyltransferase [Anaerolineae bacterium]|nr:site-specific DNA-methyltransferase [Anaerolineae bacterium]
MTETRTFLNGRCILHCGDCVAVLATLPSNSVDSIVCDPPYGLEFMGKEWDGADGFRRSLNAADAGRDSVFGRTSKKAPEYRTAGTGRKGKPGIGARDTEWVSNAGWNQFRCGTCGHLFHGGSPCQCETPTPVRADNRWNLFQEWCEAWARECLRVLKPGGYMLAFGGTKTQHRMVVAIEDAGFEIRDQIGWIYAQGFPKNDSSLKPAWEPVCVARKPLIGTVAANQAAYGTGRLNIDDCRISTDETLREGSGKLWSHYRDGEASAERRYADKGGTNFAATPGPRGGDPAGRYPANIIHDGSQEVVAAFPDAPGQQGDLRETGRARPSSGRFGDMAAPHAHAARMDEGSAARFYYAAKADADDRLGSKHPTVKPVDLMQYLVRLVTPRDGVVLDPFGGTGTTGEAAWREGRRAILIERETVYQDDIARRMELAENPTKRAAVAKTKNNLVEAADLPLFAQGK